MKFSSIVVLGTLSAPTSLAFSVVRSTVVSSSTSKLSAIIYGWDENDEDDDNASSYMGFSSDLGSAGCSPTGTAIAESLSHDQNQMGSLARLAVAFSPPERGIAIKDIEKVDVVCVREDSIDLEAILCEHGGCVSLSVPIKFPKQCGTDAEWLEGCVMKNLEDLDVSAESTLFAIQEAENLSEEDLDELCELNEKVNFPGWWIPPECHATLAADCENIRRLLNEDDFQADITALAQDILDRSDQPEVYTARKTKVAAVGPAGVCLRVGASSQLVNSLRFLDVVYPFGGEPLQDVESLRAAVLGVIAAAEDRRPSYN